MGYAKGIRGFLIGGLIVALLGAVFYSRLIRAVMIPAEMKYITPEMNLIIAVGDISSIWDGIDVNFGDVLREEDRKGLLASALSNFDGTLQDRSVPIAEKEDLLCKYGISIDKGLLVGARVDVLNLEASDPASRSVVVIPVADDRTSDESCRGRRVTDVPPPDGSPQPQHTNEQRLLYLLGRILDTEPRLVADEFVDHEDSNRTQSCAGVLDSPESAPGWRPAEHLYRFPAEDYLLFLPRRDTALLLKSCRLLEEILEAQQRNLHYAREDDALFESIRYGLQRPLLSGPASLVHLRDLAAEQFVPPVTTTLTINLLQGEVDAALNIQTKGFRSKIVDAVLRKSQGARPWQAYLDPEEEVILSIRDKSIGRYVRFASQIDEVAAFLARFLGGALRSGGAFEQVDQIVLALTGYRDGLPRFVLGLWAGDADLQQLVFETRKDLRQSRDRAVLQGAIDELEQANGSPPSSLADVLALDGLDTDPWLRRFRYGPDGLSGGVLDRADFDVPEYRDRYRGVDILYLEPETTTADLDYRLGGEVPSDSDRASLLENRDRLCAIRAGGTLWIATGREHLNALIDRVRNMPEQHGLPAADRASLKHKLELNLDTRSAIRTGLLSGDQELQRFTEDILFDFRQFPAIGITLDPAERGQGLVMQFHAGDNPNLPRQSNPVPRSIR